MQTCGNAEQQGGLCKLQEPKGEMQSENENMLKLCGLVFFFLLLLLLFVIEMANANLRDD